MRKLLCLLLIVFGAETYAASTPIKSKYDDRIQSQVYNALDVTKVYAKDGYSSISPIRQKKKSNKSRNVKKINVTVNSKPLKNPCKVPKHRKIGIM